MNVFSRAWNAVGGRMLARAGKVGHLTTTGRKSGQSRSACDGTARETGIAELKATLGSRGGFVDHADVFQLVAEG